MRSIVCGDMSDVCKSDSYGVGGVGTASIAATVIHCMMSSFSSRILRYSSSQFLQSYCG